MHALAPLILLASMLSPVRMWNPPSKPVNVHVKADVPSQLVLTDFTGKTVTSKTSTDVSGDKTIDLKALYPQLSMGGTFILLQIPKGKALSDFEATPLVIEARAVQHGGGLPEAQVIRIVPLQFVRMTTDKGAFTAILYYDVAPVTVASFLRLAEQKFYDGLTFHRIIPNFVIQGGDPMGNGQGGPGFHVQSEFNDRPHLDGVLSMARNGDPFEQSGAMPRPEYADSAGSQFFVCLDYAQCKHLDRRYTAFGRVVEGMDVVRKIAATPLADAKQGTPQVPPVIEKVQVENVTAAENPYAEMLHMKGEPAGGATEPADK